MRSAFTLIELLVVITIIVVLLALLTPALDRAIEQAERAACAANLHTWGQAHAQYYFDNKRKLLSTSRLSTTNAYPNHPKIRPETDGRAGSIALDLIGPYVQGGEAPIHEVGKIWYCPSHLTDAKKNLNDFWARITDRENPTSSADEAPDYTAVGLINDSAINFLNQDYAYFAQVGLFRDKASHPDRVTGRSLGGGKILMADVLYRWDGTEGWFYNHGEDGPSAHGGGLGSPTQTGVPKITGTNQLLGGGSVAWKPREAFDREQMEQVGRNFYTPQNTPESAEHVTYIQGEGRNYNYY